MNSQELIFDGVLALNRAYVSLDLPRSAYEPRVIKLFEKKKKRAYVS